MNNVEERDQPVPGLWLRVQANDESLARQVVEALALDRAQRIVLPFQLSTLPENTTVVRSYVGFIDDLFAHGGMILRGEHAATMEVQAQYDRGWSAGSSLANHVIGDHEAFLYPGRDEVALLDVPDLYLSVRLGKAYAGFDVTDADLVLGDITVTSEVARIETWPTMDPKLTGTNW